MTIINVLVICSKPNGVDFNFQQNKELIQKMCNEDIFEDIKFDFIDRIYNNKNYQEDIFNIYEKTYDIIWFAGCNILSWLFDMNNIQSIIQQTIHILRTNGKIIFTESPMYVKLYSLNPNSKYLTLSIENLATQTYKFNSDDLSNILKEWNSNFLLNYDSNINPEYKYYTILDIKGGNNNKKRKNKTHKNKIHKNKIHKNKIHKNKTHKNKKRKNKKHK
jgi:hypothetical protein